MYTSRSSSVLISFLCNFSSLHLIRGLIIFRVSSFCSHARSILCMIHTSCKGSPCPIVHVMLLLTFRCLDPSLPRQKTVNNKSNHHCVLCSLNYRCKYFYYNFIINFFIVIFHVIFPCIHLAKTLIISRKNHL